MDRPRRSARSSYASASGYASPSVQPTPPPVQQQQNLVQQRPSVIPNTNVIHQQAPPSQSYLPMIRPPFPQPPVHSGVSNAFVPYPLGRSNMAFPPQLAPNSSDQARITTFSSRAKLGVSTLIQPISKGDLGGFGGTDSLLRDYGGGTERTRSSGRRRAAPRYYGEDADDFDDDEDETQGSPSKGNTPLEPEEEELPPGALLGLPPPSNRVIVKRARTSHPLTFSEADSKDQAEKKEFLIPIRIEIETDSHRIRDTFTWNMREQLIKPKDFAKSFVRDLELPSEPYANYIEAAIIDQIKIVEESGIDLVEFGPAIGGPFAAAKNGQKRKRNSRNWDWGIKQSKKSLTSPIEEYKSGEYEDDLRVIVEYSVQTYRHQLRDRLEWDLCSPLTPEAFAKEICKDMSLTGEALPLIANAIREQLITHLKSVIDLDLFGKGIEYCKWQEEIEDANKEMIENFNRSQKGLEPLPLKPLQAIQEEAEEDREENVIGTRRRRGIEDDTTGSGTMTPSAIAGAGTIGNTSITNVAPQKVVLRTPEQRKSIAEFFQHQLTEKGPRRLEGVWRDYWESREFGPLLEFLTDEDLERMEIDAIRASRRGRREQQRNVGSRRRR